MPVTRHIQKIVFFLPASPKKHRNTVTAEIRMIQDGSGRKDTLPARIPVIIARNTGISGGMTGCDNTFTCACFLMNG
jgi:hypothetical protein